jgi:hypothetical protein
MERSRTLFAALVYGLIELADQDKETTLGDFMRRTRSSELEAHMTVARINLTREELWLVEVGEDG